MNTILRSISLGLACSLPVALAAQIAGASVPTPVDASHLFLAFVAVMAVETLVADYAPLRLRFAAPSASDGTGPIIARTPGTAAAEHPLAA
ncbi:MAG TPA: hypothetical protein VM029_23060 [Opitutaceae bacterium]|nr:hypothetical protein [Opitutaceae bacterium]